MDNWIDYWGQETQFVCEHHKHLSYQAIFEDLKFYVTSSDRILDFGCGEGLFASELSKLCSTLFLYDEAKPVLDKIRLTNPKSNIRIVDNYTDIKLLNIVLISSVSQYIPETKFLEILKNLRLSITQNGKIIIADIIPMQNSIYVEIVDLLKISKQNGFFTLALFRMLFSLFGNYSKVRRLVPLVKYNPKSFAKNLDQLGFVCKIEKNNLGLNSNRLTMVLTRKD